MGMHINLYLYICSYTIHMYVFVILFCTAVSYLLAIVCFTIDLPFADETRLLSVERALTDAAAQTGGMPRTTANLEKKPIRDWLPTRRA